MTALRRCLLEYRFLWRVWVPLLVVAAVVPPIALAMPLVQKQLIDDVLGGGRPDLLPGIILLYACLWIASTGGHIISGLLNAYLGQRLTVHLHRRLLAHCGNLSIAFSHRTHSGQTISLFANDAPNVVDLFSSVLVGGFSSLVTLAFGVIAMLSLSWQLALVAGIVPPLLAVVAAVVTRPLRPASRRTQEKAAELFQRIQESLAGIREIVAFGREQAESVRFASGLHELLKLRMRVAYIDTAINTGQSIFSLAVTLAIMGYGGYLVLQGQTTIGTLIAMQSLFGYVFVPANQLVGLVSRAQKALAGAERIYAFLDERPRVLEGPRARAPRLTEGAVRFERVTFGYEADRPVLRDVSFSVAPGEMVALVGPSGAGKSTLAGLIARFYDPTEGCICLDGTDVRELSLAGLRQEIGMVFQDTFLFAATIRENVCFGAEAASENAVIAALVAANAWEFIERLPAGLETLVGERGVQLSEGQKQRLAIARAILRNPRILILDEPTSALDARTEYLLQSALDNVTGGRTTFVIAHRLSTVQRASRILVLDRGRIVESGSHAELLRRNGLYRQLFDLQLGGAVLPQIAEPSKVLVASPI